jgi:hypothetical protein
VQKPAQPDPALAVTEPQLEAAPRAAERRLAQDEMPTDEHSILETAGPRGSDLAADPIDDSLELLGDDDLSALSPEIDLAEEAPAPADADAGTAGLFETPGTDLSTLPDPDADKKS